MPNVKIQVEYSLFFHLRGSVAHKEKETKIVHSFQSLMEAISPLRLDELKEEHGANELYVTSLTVISESESGQVITYLDHETKMTQIQLLNKN